MMIHDELLEPEQIVSTKSCSAFKLHIVKEKTFFWSRKLITLLQRHPSSNCKWNASAIENFSIQHNLLAHHLPNVTPVSLHTPCLVNSFEIYNTLKNSTKYSTKQTRIFFRIRILKHPQNILLKHCGNWYPRVNMSMNFSCVIYHLTNSIFILLYLDCSLSLSPHTHTHTHTHIYIYMCVCVCVCVYAHVRVTCISILMRAYSPHYDYEWLATFLIFPSDDCSHPSRFHVTEFQF